MAAQPPVLQRPCVLCCAGRQDALVGTFYRWVLDDPQIAVEPVGGHEAVIARVAAAQAEQRGRELRVAGVVDRDAYPASTLARQAELVHVLPIFEAESYLCMPALLHPTLAHLGRPIPDAALHAELVSCARATYVPAINAHLSNTPKPTGRARLEAMAAQYAAQLAAADAILDSGDTDELLRYFPGRRLLERLARRLDFLSPQHLFESVRAAVVPAEVPALAQLRADLKGRLGLG